MSWSVSGSGRALDVAQAIEKQFTESSACVEPEETVRQSTRATIAASLAGSDPDTAVNVHAAGHQSTQGENRVPSNSLTITIVRT